MAAFIIRSAVVFGAAWAFFSFFPRHGGRS